MRTYKTGNHLYFILICIIFLGSISFGSTQPSSTGIPAFPGAEGYGANSIGGRGGQVYEVTNLNDSGSGSLRACVEANNPRVCVFRIGGTIELLSPLRIRNPYITIAGQTAPGGGITLRNAPSNASQTILISTHDVIIRYINLRTGASTNLSTFNQSLAIISGYNIIIDHVSASWSTDQILTLFTSPRTESIRNVTVQWSFITEALRRSTHASGEHSNASIIGDTNIGNISLHHNLFAHSNSRTPRLRSVNSLDFVNNLIYNYGQELIFGDSSSGPLTANFIGNLVLEGPDEDTSDEFIKLSTTPLNAMRIYVQGNIDDRYRTNDTLPEDLSVKERSRSYMISNRIDTPPVTTHSCNSVTDCQVYDQILSNSGSNAYINEFGQFVLRRDAVDKRIIQEVQRREGRIVDATSSSTAYNRRAIEILSPSDYTKYGINDPIDRNGWPILASGTPPADDDRDGMPNLWEESYLLNSNDSTDNIGDADNDGYTNLEEYLNGTNPLLSDTTDLGQAPNGTITLPISGTTYNAGDMFEFDGFALDPEDGTLPPSAFTWWVELYDSTRTYPLIPPITGMVSGTFTIPIEGYTQTDITYRVNLRVRDSRGLSHQSYIDILPNLTQFSVETDPPGLQVMIDDNVQTTPSVIDSIIGVQRSLNAITPQQTVSGTTMYFDSWSDTNSADRIITTSSSPTTYVANFTTIPPSNISNVSDENASEITLSNNDVTISPSLEISDPAISKIGFLVPGQVGVTGETLQWVVTVTNNGTIPLNNVTVSDRLVDALEVIRVETPKGDVRIEGQDVFVSLGTLQPEEVVIFSIFTTVVDGVTVSNTACLEADNIQQKCATGPIISQLPTTGETPVWSYVMRLFGVTILMSNAILLLILIVRRNRKSKYHLLNNY